MGPGFLAANNDGMADGFGQKPLSNDMNSIYV
jgi:hypothetical protein